jgi:hypothetical protein
MGWCTDDSTTFLKGLGYNVVRHPREGIAPLHLVGRQNGSVDLLGPLNLLITRPSGPLPRISADAEGAKIQGQASSKLDLSIGIDVLGAIIGAFGGNLGAAVNFTNARKIQFVFENVRSDFVVPLEVGNYLRDGSVDGGNLILKQYVMGNGSLFLITRVVKSRRFTVVFERSDNVGASVNVPVIQQVAGGSVKVEVDVQKAHVLSFEGDRDLVFGFRCFEVGVRNGDLTLIAGKEGAIALAAEAAPDAVPPALLREDALVDFG